MTEMRSSNVVSTPPPTKPAPAFTGLTKSSTAPKTSTQWLIVFGLAWRLLLFSGCVSPNTDPRPEPPETTTTRIWSHTAPLSFTNSESAEDFGGR